VVGVTGDLSRREREVDRLLRARPKSGAFEPLPTDDVVADDETPPEVRLTTKDVETGEREPEFYRRRHRKIFGR